MSAFLVTRGMGGQVVASAGFGTPANDSIDEESAWNIIASDLREKDQPVSILSPYTHLHKRTI